MKCDKCGKIVPSSYDVCPYCGNVIDRTKKEVLPVEEEITNNSNNKFDLMSFIKEPNNRKYVIMALFFIIFIFLILVFLIMNLFGGNKTNYRETTNGFVSNISEYIIDNYTGNNSKKSGKYELELTNNDKNYLFSGSYQLDTKNKIFNLENLMEDPNKKDGGVIAEFKELPFNIYLNGDEFYFESSIINDIPIYFPIDDLTGLLSTKNYDITAFIYGYEEAILEGLKQVYFSSSKEEIDFLGEKKSFNKGVINFDNETIIKFSDAYYQTLIDDNNFINEYARIKSRKADEIIEMINNYMTTNQYKYGGDTKDDISLSIYIDNDEIKRMLYVNNDIKYQLDFGDSKYYLSKYDENKKVMEITFSEIIKETIDTINRTWNITYKSDETDIVINLKLFEDISPEVKKKIFENAKNIRDFSGEDILRVKNILLYYISNVDWVDEFKAFFNNKCNPDLICNCQDNEEICQCNYNGDLIKCNINDVIKADEQVVN